MLNSKYSPHTRTGQSGPWRHFDVADLDCARQDPILVHGKLRILPFRLVLYLKELALLAGGPREPAADAPPEPEAVWGIFKWCHTHECSTQKIPFTRENVQNVQFKIFPTSMLLYHYITRLLRL